MSSTTVHSERRKKLRKKPLRLVYVELASGNGGMMRDLSEEGFAVRAMMPVRQGDQTTFSFTLGDSTRIEGEGKVLWIEEGGRVAGVEFLKISPEMKTRIEDWLIEDEKIGNPREVASESVIAASTIEELREELRATPVRGEATPPEVEEQTRAAVEPAQPVEVKSEVEIVSKEEPKPTVIAPTASPTPPANEPVVAPAAPASSVTEAFFLKWPRNPSPQVRKTETRATESAEPTEPSPSYRTQEETEDEGYPQDSSPPLPDISEILIQPHGMSAGAGARSSPIGALPELPESDSQGRANWEWFTLTRAVLIMIVLTFLAGMYVYHREVGRGLIWLGEALGGGSENVAKLAGDRVAGGGAPTGSAANPAQPVNSGSDAGNTQNPTTEGASNAPSSLSSASKGASPPVTPLAGITPPASAEASPDAGQSEYLQAVQILRGRNAGTDTPEAVRLLWVAVEKGNPSAEVTLADLYWHGQGVVRNCDQTRILLTAAARKGSSEAQKRLQQFQQEGCE